MAARLCWPIWSTASRRPIRSSGSLRCMGARGTRMARQIIVTGAAGFIGRNVVAELNSRGRMDLLLVDLPGHGDKWKNLRGLKFENIISPDELLELVARNAIKDTEA